MFVTNQFFIAIVVQLFISYLLIPASFKTADQLNFAKVTIAINCIHSIDAGFNKDIFQI